MNNTIVARSIKSALIVGTTAFAFLSLYQPPKVVWGLLIGTVSSAFNLYLLSLFSQILFTPLLEKKLSGKGMGSRYVVSGGLTLLKFPIFYGLLVVLFYTLHFSITSFMIGFSIPLCVIVLKTVGPILFVDRGRKIWQVGRNR